MFMNAIKLYHTTFGINPERLDTIDMVRANGKHICTMIDAEVFVKADVH